MNPILFEFLKNISVLGGEKMMMICTVILFLVVFFWHKEKRLALFILFNYLATEILVVGIKYIVNKPRNPLALIVEPSPAFPSGHVAAAMTTFLILWYLSRFIKENKLKILARMLGSIWLVLIVSDRLLLRVHDIYDVIAAILISLFVFSVSINLKYFKRKILKKEIKIID